MSTVLHVYTIYTIYKSAHLKKIPQNTSKQQSTFSLDARSLTNSIANLPTPTGGVSLKLPKILKDIYNCLFVKKNLPKKKKNDSYIMTEDNTVNYQA